MSIYDISVERIHACTLSTTAFIMMISDIEGALQVINALNHCGVPDHIDEDGWPDRTMQILSIAQMLGHASEAQLIPDRLFERYVADLIVLGHQTDAYAWNYGFRAGVTRAIELRYEEQM
ncbi:hypothetical protein R8124_000593 [Salmonella enterica]|nr:MULTISPECIES: hypothetical protein [Enterobacteriaceae]EKG5011686.1 hypothetical protein [Salmonella enterica]HAB1649515.1 hypothetical protein [Salmonella enterica subsp. enterica]EBY8685151.1 hypothetical protein [Salmonella enterica subsp. enterica serovar Agona]EHW1978095.1 hypothetical protein [Salmonella enterica subsp. enterica serovar Agona]EKG5048363.1 hypothetical protein [Salmonella enterica]